MTQIVPCTPSTFAKMQSMIITKKNALQALKQYEDEQAARANVLFKDLEGVYCSIGICCEI